MAFEADPDAFAREYADEDSELARRIAAARAAVGDVDVTRQRVARGSRRCVPRSVSTGCAPISWWRALQWRTLRGGARAPVGEEDIRVAAQLALPHRRRRDPFDEPGLDEQTLDEALARAHDERLREESTAQEDPEPGPDPPGGGGESAESTALQASSGGTPETRGAPPAPPFRTRLLTVPGVGDGAPGRRSRARNRSGAVVSAHATDGSGVHLFGTVMAAARRAKTAGPPRVDVDDVRRAIREGRERI